MSRLPTPNSDKGIWGQILNDFLGVAHNPDGTLKAAGTIASKADDNTVVHNSGAENIAGTKTFLASPVIPTPTAPSHAATKLYVDSAVTAGAPDASPTTKGIVQLAGDLSGTATAPTVPGLTAKEPTLTAGTTAQYYRGDKSWQTLDAAAVSLGNVDNTSDANKPVSSATTTALNLKADKVTIITAGTGLTGGGDLSTNRTLTVSYGVTAGTAAQGNDTRITGAVQSTIVDAKGDLIVASAADAIARLGVGSDAQILTADSTQALGVKWGTPTATFQGNGYVGLGDSISSVTGGAGYGASWTILAPALGNQRLNYLANAGVSGNNTAQMLARISTDVLAYLPQVCTVLGGTNDLTQAVTFGTYKSNITSIITTLRDAKILPVLCTIPPRGNTTYLTTTITWNNWLRAYARQQGLPLIDFFTLLVDPVTGMFVSGYDSGDALHPSQAAHVLMATLVSTQLTVYLPPYSPLRAVSNVSDADNLISNPLMLNGSPTPTSYVTAGTGMTGYTEQLVTDTDFLGKAWEWNFTNPSNAAGFRQVTQTLPASWAVGNTLLFVMRLKVVSKSSVTPGNNIGVRMSASFFSSASPTVVFTPGDVTVHPSGLYWFKYVVPAGTTSVAINAGVFNIPTTGQLTARVGEFAVFNLTSLALP